MVRKRVKIKTDKLRWALNKAHIPTWLLWVLILVFVLRIPSFFEPFWYGDEMIYLTLGEALRRGLVFYRDIHDNKPPLLYLLAAVAGNVFWFRVILTFWTLTTVYFFWRLARLLFVRSQKLVKIAVTSFAILTSIPLLEGNIANAEVFMIGPIILGFWLLFEKGLTQTRIFLAGLAFGLAALFKIPASFDLAAIGVFWLAGLSLTKLKSKDLWEFAQKVLFLAAGFLLPILVTILYYWIAGALERYLVAALAQNVGYLSSWRVPTDGQTFFDRNGPLLTRGGITLLISGVAAYLYQKKRVSSGFFFVSSWFAFSLFGALLSERPYPHYLIQVVPSFSLLLGVLFAGAARERFYPLPLLAFLGVALIFYKFGYYAVFPYYENFLLWTTGSRSNTAYFASFDRRVPRTYEVASYISRHTTLEEPIFVWGNDTAIYALSRRLPPGRYVAAYHINDFAGQEETISALRSSPPSYIVLIEGERDFPQLEAYIEESFILIQEVEDAQLYKRVSPEIKGRLYKR